jgi:serine/threonine protein phosphatase PrpC
VALMQGSNIHVGMVGDSRLFHIRNGRMIWRTLDHTRVQMLLDEGMLSEDEARGHPESGMLTRALGHSRMADGTPLAPEVFADPVSIEPGDAVVMSSDGLHDLVEDWEIAKAVAGAAPEAAAESLVALANQRGGHDNVTVAVVIAGEVASQFDPDFVPESDWAQVPETLPGFETQELQAESKMWMWVGIATVLFILLMVGLAVGLGAAYYYLYAAG